MLAFHLSYSIISLMYKFLSKEQRQELIDELKIERSRRYAERIKVILLLDEGQTYKNIAHFLFLDEGTIANYRKRYKKGGIEGLVIDDYARNRMKLTEEEETILSADLQSKIFPSTKEIIDHVQKKFNVYYSVSGITHLLHRLGFSFKKAKGIPGKAKKEDQAKFIRSYNALKSHGKVYFGDGTHPRHNSILSYGWIKKGTEKNVFTNSGRFHVNLFGAVCIENQETIIRSYPTIGQEHICEFLKVLRNKNPGNEKLYLILDKGPYNRAGSVKALAKELNIKLVYLPAYSPNLNPIERLWKFFKKKVLYNQYYEKQDQFIKACSNFFRGIRKYKAELATLLTDNFSPVGT